MQLLLENSQLGADGKVDFRLPKKYQLVPKISNF
jgi:hypothetical protein